MMLLDPDSVREAPVKVMQGIAVLMVPSRITGSVPLTLELIEDFVVLAGPGDSEARRAWLDAVQRIKAAQ